MPIKSDNTHGNPYHDEGTGEFTSPDAASSANNSADVSAKSGTFAIKLKEGVNVDDIKKELSERQLVYRMPFFQSASDIENYIEDFFPKKLVDELVQYYDFSGTRSRPFDYPFFTFSDGSKGLQSNLFVQILSKYRYPQLYCDTISNEEFNHAVSLIKAQGSGKFTQYYDDYTGYPSHDLDRLAQDNDIGCGLVLGYRGIQFAWDRDGRQKLREALDSYIGLHTTQPSYSDQGCYGTVNYVAMSKNYARRYDGYGGHIMKHIIDVRNAKIMYEPQVNRIKSALTSHASSIQQRLENHFSTMMDSDKAAKLAQGVIGSIKYDFGFTCALMGGDVVIAGIDNGNQIDVLNWKIARMLKDW